MPLMTTCIGAYPKLPYVPRMLWFHDAPQIGEAEAGILSPEERRAAFDGATREAVAEQAEIGIDIPTDGEIRRANYIHYHCSHLDGFELDTLTECTMRNGAWTAEMPTFTGKVAAREPFLVRDWEVAQSATDRPIKITVPGPLTIADATANVFYSDRRSWCADLADALNVEIRRLADAGCRHIQVDEPLFARLPDQALEFGIENLERCFHGVIDDVTRTVHICCGYPDMLDETDYVKGRPGSLSAACRRRRKPASWTQSPSGMRTGTTIFPCSACSPTPRSSSVSSRSPPAGSRRSRRLSCACGLRSITSTPTG